jgi:hypothetical protein
MASSQHPSFPIRPYASSSQQPAPSTTRGKPLNFSQSHAPAAREAARLERERLERERLERERQAQQAVQQPAQGQSAISQLTDEQRDEVNEAVSPPLLFLPEIIPDNAIVWTV